MTAIYCLYHLHQAFNLLPVGSTDKCHQALEACVNLELTINDAINTVFSELPSFLGACNTKPTEYIVAEMLQLTMVFTSGWQLLTHSAEAVQVTDQYV